MIKSSRRQFLASSAGVAALGLTGQLAFLPSAQAMDLRKSGHYKYKVGDVEIISIYDGIWQNSGFDAIAPGVSGDDVKAALSKGGLTTEYIPIEFAFTVIKTGGKTILLDAGTGAQLAPTAGLAAKGGLEAAGITPDSVDAVILSHLHPDHIFGLMEKETNAQVYPNAEIMIGETEYNFWTAPDLIEKLPEQRRGLAKRIQATFPTWKNVSLYKEDKELAPGVRAVPSFGHTAGHVSIHVSSGDDELMLIGDAIALPALFLSNLDWQFMFDADKDQATATRKAIVEQAVADNMTIGGYHFGFPNAGKFEKDGASHVFVPAEV